MLKHLVRRHFPDYARIQEKTRRDIVFCKHFGCGKVVGNTVIKGKTDIGSINSSTVDPAHCF
ncbi:hypothetical protein DFE_2857 [Desulfovibrio ferrophilus]|uniref:Uncharacterized protein n=1 Tax=Desulfovibrio ferrophilus TaxID=241368 RepID=A0A2Z6B2A4_9BACT|nr:hypothetical protein DFE_2857 [Desulfovibrio ferrophilus]